MKRAYASVLALPLLIHANPLQAAITKILSPNYDLTYSTQFPNGDKPEVGCTPPTSLTEANVGDGGGEFCELTSTSFTGTTLGSSSIQKNHYAYQSVGTGDFQIKLRITNTYTGSQEALASYGLGVRSGGSATDPFYQIFSPYATGFVAQCNAGTSAADVVNVNGPTGSRPIYLALTGDESSNQVKGFISSDGSAYTEVCGYTGVDFTNWRGYMFGQSKSPTATLSADLDNFDFDIGPGSITVYTPTDPPVGSPPTLVTPIPNQTGTLGSAFALDISANFTGETSYSASGLPSGTGLTFNTSVGQLTGTPTSQDVAASSYNLSLCGINGDGSTCDVALFTFTAPPPGDTIVWTSGMSDTRTCAQLGAGPGDTVIIQGDANNYRPKLEIIGCVGTAQSPITFKNDATENTPLRIGSGTDFIMTLRNLEYVVVDGTDGYVGAPARGCGRYEDADKMAAPVFPRTCGIKVVRENSGGTAVAGSSNSGIKLREGSRFVTVKGVEVDGSDDGIRLGFSGNDHQTNLPTGTTQLECQSAAQGGPTQPDCQWIEGIDIWDNYVHDTVAEALYAGSNYAQDGDLDYPLRNVKVRDNIVIDSGYDGLSVKSCIDDTGGRCEISGNYVDGAGTAGLAENGNSGACLDTWEGGYTDFFNNVVLNCYGPGIQVSTKHRPDDFGPATTSIYNNMIINASIPNNGGKKGINVVKSTGGQNGVAMEVRPQIYNNTIVTADGGAISVSGGISNCSIRNNLATGTTTQQNITAGACTSTANEQETVANSNFAASGSGNYRLTSTSPACNSATGAAPDDDFEGTVRPQDSADDQGADESASCPAN